MSVLRRIVPAPFVLAFLLVRAVSASAVELPPAPEGTFSIAVLPDTQHYRGRGTKLEPDGAEGLRVYRFVPKENTIYVQTFNPLKGALCTGTEIVPDPRQHQFILSYDMRLTTTSNR